MGQHAILAPSGAEKWMACPGAPAMEVGLPDDSNEYSDEGTAAHLLGSTCLERGTDTEDYIGQDIVVGHMPDGWDGARWYVEDIPDTFEVRRTYSVDEDMAADVGKYVRSVREHQGEGVMLPEQRVGLSHLTGEEGAKGTTDAGIARGDELQAHDLKFGRGVAVDAFRNKQLLIYISGLREEMEPAYGPFNRFRVVIHQPRLGVVSAWDCSAEELEAFENEVKAAAMLALGLYHGGARPDDPEWVKSYLRPSEDACRWCKAKATCPALAKFVTDAMSADFEALATGEDMAADAEPSNVAVVPLDPVVLGQKMAAIPLIEDFCKAVRAKVDLLLREGTPVPGFKLVMGKKGNRQWTDEEAVEEILKSMRLKTEERYNLKLKSPTQILKFLKTTPKRAARIENANLITQRDGVPSVAPESDPRDEWVPPDPADDFTAEPEVTA